MTQSRSDHSKEKSPTKLFQTFAAGLWNSEREDSNIPQAPKLSDVPQLAKLSELIGRSSHRPTSGIPAPNGFATEPDFRAGVTSDEEASTSAPSVARTRRQPFRRKSVVSSLTPQEEDKYDVYAATEHSLRQQNKGRRRSFDQQSSSAAVTRPWTEQPSVLGDQHIHQQHGISWWLSRKEGLRRSLSAARQTFANCHDNFQSLGGLVQKGLRFRGLPAVQTPGLGSQPAGSENVTFTTHPSAMGSLPFSEQGIQLFPGGQLVLADGNADLLPCYVKLKARDMALLEAALAELTKERRFGSSKGQTTDAPGPLQMPEINCFQPAYALRA
ncbi:hypothetical protein WJX74_000707 [Apatococcus lobatus]|uniref:Uncharacterized protein n=1 Tax=Apatococcus lobatus TaxID=904363 RepID=A0AAW1QH53_9CHLO